MGDTKENKGKDTQADDLSATESDDAWEIIELPECHQTIGDAKEEEKEIMEQPTSKKSSGPQHISFFMYVLVIGLFTVFIFLKLLTSDSASEDLATKMKYKANTLKDTDTESLLKGGCSWNDWYFKFKQQQRQCDIITMAVPVKEDDNRNYIQADPHFGFEFQLSRTIQVFAPPSTRQDDASSYNMSSGATSTDTPVRGDPCSGLVESELGVMPRLYCENDTREQEFMSALISNYLRSLYWLFRESPDQILCFQNSRNSLLRQIAALHLLQEDDFIAHASILWRENIQHINCPLDTIIEPLRQGHEGHPFDGTIRLSHRPSDHYENTQHILQAMVNRWLQMNGADGSMSPISHGPLLCPHPPIITIDASAVTGHFHVDRDYQRPLEIGGQRYRFTRVVTETGCSGMDSNILRGSHHAVLLLFVRDD